MRFEDDTPEPKSLVEPYPRDPPRNLLQPPLLAPSNFFAVEGLDGGGKSTILARVAEHCHRIGHPMRGIKLGGSDVVRHAMERAKWINADPMTFNLLNWTSLYEQITALRDEFNTATALFVDRYTMTIRIRGMLEGLPHDVGDVMTRLLPRPAVLFLVDCDVETCIARLLSGGRAISYFEAGTRHVDRTGDMMIERSPAERTSAFARVSLFRRHLTRMREAMLRLAETYENVEIIDNNGPIDAAVAAVLHSAKL